MLVAFGLIIHVIFLLSIFDIYFKSPVVEGVPPYQPIHEASAKRLVLFVADGLRAESFLEHNHTPYLRSIASNIGLWGISNTRVPTESRPGHVAIIAGFYEDPSAVAKGWKKNPVDFDSVFNQSRYTWCWGADDILHIFSKETNDNHIVTYAYNTDDQDFSIDKNTTLLDGWVFDRVEEFLRTAKYNSELYDKLKSDKIIFFLHLLGLDTSGHSHKPNTYDFITNLKFVDEGVSKMESLFEEFYNDSKTAYVLTSDHGMTDWGSHGSGDIHETETPYVVWGAGFARQITDAKGYEFGLPRSRRRDIKQADFAPLMASLLSIPVPVNSVGQLPPELLGIPKRDLAASVYSNSRQLAAQYNRKRELVETYAIQSLYRPYTPLTKEKYDEIIDYTEKLLKNGESDKLIELSREISELSLKGLNYYYNYYQSFLLICISLSFIGWIANLLTQLMINSNVKCQHGHYRKGHRIFFNVICGLVIVVVFYGILVQRLPLQYLIYTGLPIVLWWRVLTFSNLWSRLLNEILKEHTVFGFGFKVFSYLLGTSALVASFSHRWFLIIPLIGMAVWPLYIGQVKTKLLFGWAATCFGLGIFAYLPVVGKDANINLVIIATVIWQIVSIVYRFKLLPTIVHRKKSVNAWIWLIQTVLLSCATLTVWGQGSLPFFVAWILAGVSLLVPLASGDRQICRLFSINTSILSVYTLLSVAHEALFLVTLMLNLAFWLMIEARGKKLQDLSFSPESNVKGHINAFGLTNFERSLTEEDFRRAFFFLVYIIISFFGTGNIASINSFEVRWVLCFVTTFRPFVITFLVLCKTMLPFLCTTCAFRALNINTRAPTGYLVIVLILCDLMGLQLLFQVRNTGSWLEIGTSISQYVIAQVITLFIVLLYAVAHVFTSYSVLIPFLKNKKYV